MVNNYIPERGDIVLINFNPQTGHEQAGKRPALTITPALYNKIGLAIFCPITQQAKGYPFEVSLHSSKTTGVILTDHLKNLDWKARKASFLEKISPQELDSVLKLLNILIIDPQ